MKLIFIAALLILTFSLNAQTSQDSVWIRSFLNNDAIKNAPISICVKDLSTSKVILGINEDLSLTPASVQKIMTTATAFKVLGKDFRFETNLAFNGKIQNDTLLGNLIVVGGGDPTLGSAVMFGKENRSFYIEWIHAIKQAGIHTIIGDIIVDPSVYVDQDVPQTWIWEDLGNYYGASAQGITLYDNTFRLIFKTEDRDGGNTEVIRTEPFIPELHINNYVRASNDYRDRSVVFGSPYDSFRTIKGTLPKGRQEYGIRASIPDPSLLLAYELKQELIKSGIDVSGEAIRNQTHDKINIDSIFMQWYSPPLFKIIRELNFFSVNLFAEQLCKQIGLTIKGEGSTRAGVQATKEYWEQQNLATNFVFLADGSGLSRSNASSSKILVDVLEFMYHDTINGIYFENSLPITGMQGTQQYYFQNSILKGKAHVKSGSMTRVRSFAGYLTTQKGTSVAFAVIVNNFNKESFPMAKKLEELIEEINLNL